MAMSAYGRLLWLLGLPTTPEKWFEACWPGYDIMREAEHFDNCTRCRMSVNRLATWERHYARLVFLQPSVTPPCSSSVTSMYSVPLPAHAMRYCDAILHSMPGRRKALCLPKIAAVSQKFYRWAGCSRYPTHCVCDRVQFQLKFDGRWLEWHRTCFSL